MYTNHVNTTTVYPLCRALGRALSLVLLLVGFMASGRAAEPPAGVLYHEDFTRYAAGATPPGFSDSCTVAEEHGEKYLQFVPGKGNNFYRTPDQTQGGSRKWTNYELDLRLRIPDGAKTTLYTIVRDGGERPAAKYMYYYVPLSADTCGAYAHGMKDGPPTVSARWVDAGAPPMQPGTWQRVVIRLAGTLLRISREVDGKLLPVLEDEIAPGGGGFNLMPYGLFDVKEITVREITAAEIAATPTGLQEVDGLRVALSPTRLTVDVPAEAGEVRTCLRTGRGQPGVKLTLHWSDGATTAVTVRAAAATLKRRVKTGNETKEETVPLPDAYIDIQPWRIRSFVRPNPDTYPAKLQEELAAKWNTLPAASAYDLPLALRLDANGLEYWIDGRYAGRLDSTARLQAIAVRLPTGAGIGEVSFGARGDTGRFLPLDITRLNRPGVFDTAVSTLKPGRIQVKGTPFLVDGRANADIGLAKELTGGGLEVDPYLARTAFDGMPESLLYAVPLAQYTHAWLLCAVDDDPKKEPVLTARVTRFTSDGRGDAIADTTVWLPRGTAKPGPGITPAGTVTYTVDGAKRQVPLWLVEVPLKIGEIQDLLFADKFGMLPDKRYLDVELLGKLDRAYAQNDRSHKPDKASVSGVHVFGVTLERSPVEMEVTPAQPGNIYQGDEQAEMRVALRPREAGSYTVRWQFRDVDERPAGGGEKKVTLTAGAAQTITVPLAQQETGWYGVEVSLLDRNGRRLLTHPAACALLPADTRTAEYDSPYGTWWFDGAHHGTADIAVVGPLLRKAGLRKTTISAGKGNTEASMAPWKVTSFQVPWMGYLFNNVDIPTGQQKYEAAVREHLKNFPHCDAALIFHENYGGDCIPAELRNAVPAPLDDARAKSSQRRQEIAKAVTEVLRKFPNLKIVFGNCNPSPGLLAEFFRDKYPRENIDYLGIEAAGQTFLPEKLTEYGTQAGWVLRESGRKFGYDIPLTACYEWLYRTQRDLGPQQLAEWYARDAMIAHAYRFPHISLALTYDAGNCYYNSLWGASGLCQRYPVLYPKPVYVSYATLTRILDRVTLMRRVPTGSLTVYALEFSRGNERVYTLWTPRGTCAATLRFAGDAAVTVVDLYGRQRQVATKNRELVLQAGTAVHYLISAVPVERITAGARRFPQEQPPATATVASAMDTLAAWELQPGKDDRLDLPESTYLPLRTAGAFTLTEATDPEQGKCLELSLQTAQPVPEVVNEYTVLKLKEPVLLPGRPTTLGVWVKGNSGWGRVMWEFQDAEGETWLSCGETGWGCDSLDWAGLLSIDFDGWCFLRYPLTEDSPVKVISPGSVGGQWVRRNGNRKVDYPIKVTGLAVEMPRKALDLTEMVPITPTIRLKNLSAY